MIVAATKVEREGALRKIVTAAIVAKNAGRAMASKGYTVPSRGGVVPSVRRDATPQAELQSSLDQLGVGALRGYARPQRP